MQRLGLRSTGEKTSFADQTWTGCRLPQDWFLVVEQGCEGPLVSPESLAALTTDREAVACSIEEHVMFSSAEFWRDGRRIWRIRHDAQKSTRHIATEGDLPAVYAEKLQHATTEQDAEDQERKEVDFFFEIPLEVAREIVGFKHDNVSPEIDVDAFTLLESLSERRHSSRSRWWQIWK